MPCERRRGRRRWPTRKVTSDDRGVVDRVEQPRRLVVVRPEQRRRRRRRRGQHHGVGLESSRSPDRTVQPPADAARGARPGAESRMSTPRVGEAGGERVRPATPCRRRGPRTAAARRGRAPGTSARRARIRLPRRWAAASSGGNDRGRGHVVDRAGVDAADQGVDQRVDDPLAELARHERPDGAVADRPAHVGPGQRRVAGEAQPCRRGPEDAGAGGGPEPGRDPEREALGQRAQPAAGPDRRAPRRDRARARRPARPRGTGRRASGRRPRKPSGPRSTTRPPTSSLRSGAAEARRGLEHDDRGRAGARLGPAGQLPGRRQPADAAADDDHPAAAPSSGAPSAADDDVGQDVDERGVVVERGRAGVGRARTRPPRAASSTSRS